MKVVVKKFGGTCVESEESQNISAERIMESKDKGIYPVIVVSAAGRLGQPYSTAELVQTATRINPQIKPRELDMLMSCGEIISTVAMANLLSGKGYDTIALSGGQAGIITDVYHGHAHIIRLEPDGVLKALQARKMVFVTGFQGVSERHAITTLGEGGSDYTAVALAVILGQKPQLPFGDELEMMPLHIFKDVDGVMTTNPDNLTGDAAVETARLLNQLSFDECVEMSRLGAEVLQHKASVMARKHGIQLMVRNFRNAEWVGTCVGTEPAPTADGKATAVADIPNLVLFSIKSDNPRLSSQLAEHFGLERLFLFELTAREPGEVSFAIKREKYRDVIDLVERMLFLRGIKAQIGAGGWGLVSLVGEKLSGDKSPWQKSTAKALKNAGIEVPATTCGDLSVSCLVSEEQRIEAVKLLHSRFVL